MVTVTFPDDVFVEEPPAWEADVRVRLTGPTGAEVGSWTDTATIGAVADITVLDARTIEITVVVPEGAPAGAWALWVMGNGAGACMGPNGTVGLMVGGL